MFNWFIDPLLDLVFPEDCRLCGVRRGAANWSPGGPGFPGLRFWDSPFLCGACEESLNTGVVHGELGVGTGSHLQVVAAAQTHPDLVRLVGGLKYHGLRGLAWPLTRILHHAYLSGCEKYGPVEALVPVALHSRRQRSRGFNQAEILCSGLQLLGGPPVSPRILTRRRGTAQQAKLAGADTRRRNLAGAFRALGPEDPKTAASGRVRRVCLVDDLVTSGWTIRAAAEALQGAGWQVAWVLALGLSAEIKNPGGQVDTREGGF